MTGLIVDGVSKVYKKKTALYPCSFEVNRGKVCCFVRRKRCWKKYITANHCRILYPSSGTTTINERGIKYDRENYLKEIVSCQMTFMPRK